MITKEAIEAAARAACEDNVQRIHKAAHDSGSSASMSGSEYYMYPPHGWPDFLASIEAALTAALAAMPGPAVAYMHRLVGTEEWNVSLPDAMGHARKYQALFPDRIEIQPLYSALTPAPDLASENERLRAAWYAPRDAMDAAPLTYPKSETMEDAE